MSLELSSSGAGLGPLVTTWAFALQARQDGQFGGQVQIVQQYQNTQQCPPSTQHPSILPPCET